MEPGKFIENGLVTIRLASGDEVTFPSEDFFESRAKDLAKSGVSRDVIQEARLKRDALEFDANVRLAREMHPVVSGTAGRLSSFVQNFGEGALPGAASTLSAAVTAPVTAVRRDIGLGEAFQVNKQRAGQVLGASPAAAVAGRLASAFAPTPINKIGAVTAAKGANVFGAATKAAALADDGRLGLSAVAQIGSSIAGNTLATAAVSVPDLGTDVIFGSRSIEDAASDLGGRLVFGAGFGAVTGAGTAIFREPARKALVDLFAKARRKAPGLELPPDAGRDPEGFIGSLVDTMSRSPFGRKAVRGWLKSHFYEPLERSISRLEQSVGAGDLGETALRAGRVVERLPERVKKAREAASAPIKGPAGQVGVPRAEMAKVIRVIRDTANAARRKGTEEPRSALVGPLERLSKVLQKANASRRAGGEGTITVASLDETRQQVGRIARFGRIVPNDPLISSRDVRDAKKIYYAIREAERAASPDVGRALSSIAGLRRLEDSLAPVLNVADEGAQIAAARRFFEAKDALRRWERASRMLDPSEVQKLRGVYLADFFDRVAITASRTGENQTRVLRGRVMRDLWAGKGAGGKFNRQFFDRVLPGFREELDDLGQASQSIREGIGRAEGSQTAGRLQMDYLAREAADMVQDGLDMATGNTAAGIGLFKKSLGAMGSFFFAKSLLSGETGRRLVGLATGQPATPGINPLRGVAGGRIPVPAAAAVASGDSVTRFTENALQPVRGDLPSPSTNPLLDISRSIQ